MVRAIKRTHPLYSEEKGKKKQRLNSMAQSKRFWLLRRITKLRSCSLFRRIGGLPMMRMKTSYSRKSKRKDNIKSRADWCTWEWERRTWRRHFSKRKSEKRIQEIQFHSLSCCPGSRTNNWSDCERIDKKSEACRQRGWGWFSDSWK